MRSCLALRDICLAYEIPLLSGKDSMYVDGHLQGKYGETHKISALETLQFSTIAVIGDIEKCVTMECKVPGDLVYVLGVTRNELGGSEYYEHLGYVGLNVPKVIPEAFLALYGALSEAIDKELVASAHGIFRGGMAVHLAMTAMGGNLGMNVHLDRIPVEQVQRDDVLLFSESAGRFVVSIDPQNKDPFEKIFAGLPCASIGEVTNNPQLVINAIDDTVLVNIPVAKLKTAWKKPFGALI